ncbi:WhiB family transcriptional regulator [Agromyces tardus]|uniref:WhiB family transcriptional regulator n=1 Tax=Agromyces tardus TaxID=2583849 RepID=UPI0036237550
MWDYNVEHEKKPEQQARLQEARTLCISCPLRIECERYHLALADEFGRCPPGVWGGRVFPDGRAQQAAA